MKIDKIINELLILIVAIIMVACAPSTPEGSGIPIVQVPTAEPTLPTEENDATTSEIQPNEELRENPLLGTDWNLVSLNGQMPTGDITLQFDAEQVGGSDGCNGYGATYTVTEDRIIFDTNGFMSTMMACEPAEIMADGRAYLDALSIANRYELGAGTLTIYTKEGQLDFAMPQNTALEGTTWTLNSTMEENGSVSMAIDQDIYFSLADGTVSGSTGCNTFGGVYKLGGDELSFDQLYQTEMACLDEDVSQRETQMNSVLNNTVRYSISRNTLTLENENGDVLATFSTEVIDEDTMTDEPNINLNGTSWILSNMVTSELASKATLTATFEDGLLAGSAGCNRYTTSYQVDETRLNLEAIATTRRLCDEVTNVDEQAFLEKMGAVATFVASAETLTLNDANGDPLLVFTRDPQDDTQVSLDNSEKTFYIGAEQADCVGVAPQKCLLVKEDPAGDYQFFYSNIVGFEWEAGFEYELRVRVTEVENPPADASSLSYELIEVVNKTPVDG